MTARPAFFQLSVLPLALAALVVAGSGCRKRSHVDGTVAVDTILAAWTAEGFATAAVANVEPDPWSAGACSRGSVAGLDVLLCEYANDETMRAGEQKVMSDWQRESVPTGAAAQTSRTLLAIADRTAADPSGKTIARLVKSFRDQH